MRRLRPRAGLAPRRKSRLKNLLQQMRRNPRPVILHRQHHRLLAIRRRRNLPKIHVPVVSAPSVSTLVFASAVSARIVRARIVHRQSPRQQIACSESALRPALQQRPAEARASALLRRDPDPSPCGIASAALRTRFSRIRVKFSSLSRSLPRHGRHAVCTPIRGPATAASSPLRSRTAWARSWIGAAASVLSSRNVAVRDIADSRRIRWSDASAIDRTSSAKCACSRASTPGSPISSEHRFSAVTRFRASCAMPASAIDCPAVIPPAVRLPSRAPGSPPGKMPVSCTIPKVGPSLDSNPWCFLINIPFGGVLADSCMASSSFSGKPRSVPARRSRFLLVLCRYRTLRVPNPSPFLNLLKEKPFAPIPHPSPTRANPGTVPISEHPPRPSNPEIPCNQPVAPQSRFELALCPIPKSEKSETVQ